VISCSCGPASTRFPAALDESGPRWIRLLGPVTLQFSGLIRPIPRGGRDRAGLARPHPGQRRKGEETGENAPTEDRSPTANAVLGLYSGGAEDPVFQLGLGAVDYAPRWRAWWRAVRGLG